MSLLLVALLVSAILAIVTRKPGPRFNCLHFDDGVEERIFEIDDAAFGVHMEGTKYFITFLCSTSRQLSPDSKPNSHPRVEFSIPFDTDPTAQIRGNNKFQIPVYDETYGNLNYYYYWSFDDIENGILTINRVHEKTIDATVVANGGTLMFRAKFRKKSDISRSFN